MYISQRFGCNFLTETDLKNYNTHIRKITRANNVSSSFYYDEKCSQDLKDVIFKLIQIIVKMS